MKTETKTCDYCDRETGGSSCCDFHGSEEAALWCDIENGGILQALSDLRQDIQEHDSEGRAWLTRPDDIGRSLQRVSRLLDYAIEQESARAPRDFNGCHPANRKRDKGIIRALARVCVRLEDFREGMQHDAAGESHARELLSEARRVFVLALWRECGNKLGH